MGTLGERLLRARTRSSMTLERAAKQTDITKGYLSRIENDRAMPSIAVLSRLAQVYGVPMADLFAGEGEDQRFSLVRAQERLQVIRDGSEVGYVFEAVAFRKAQRSVESFVVTMPPGIKRGRPYRHAGEELFFILEGRCRFLYGGVEYVLEAGDCVYFDASVEHRGDAEGSETARALAVIVPPPKAAQLLHNKSDRKEETP